MAQINLKPHLIAVEHLIRSGRGGEARERLGFLLAEGFPSREARRSISPLDRAHLIQLLRRSGGGAQALDFGYDFIRGDTAELTPPTLDEKLEYAAALIFSGLEGEGLALLDEVPALHSPLVHLYRAFGYFPRWEYERAEAELQSFLARSDEAEYFYHVGKINHASSLVYLDRLDEAEVLLRELLTKTEDAATGLLRSNALELFAQLYLKRGVLDGAERALTEARSLVGDAESLYRLFIDKWFFVLELKRNREFTEDHRQTMWELTARARYLGHFETVRDLRLQSALARPQGTTDEFCALMAGTPHEAYRARIRAILADTQWPTHASLVVGPGAIHEAWRLKGARSAAHHTRWALPASSLKHARLLQILLSDLYSPWRLPRLFQTLFPGRWYDAASARNLLHQSVHELRKKLKEEAAPFVVVWDKEMIYLKSASAVQIDLALEPGRRGDSLLEGRALELFNEIKNTFGLEAFTKTKLRAHVSSPERSLQRYLKTLVEGDYIERLGGGRGARYKIRGER